jgi:hypothetical protein
MPPSGMTVGLVRGVKVPLLVWTCIVALDDGYVARVAAANPNQVFRKNGCRGYFGERHVPASEPVSVLSTR